MLPMLPEPSVLVATDPRQSFLTLLPVIETHARTAFRTIRHYHDREDAVAEVIAHAWATFSTIRTKHIVTAKALAELGVAAVRAALTQANC